MSQSKSDENVSRLEAYLSSVEAIPARGGKASVAAIALAAGIDRQVLYRNPRAKALLDATIIVKGLVHLEDRSPSDRSEAERALERKVRSLEARNAALSAEISALRTKLRGLEHIEQMALSGRRVIP